MGHKYAAEHMCSTTSVDALEEMDFFHVATKWRKYVRLKS